MKTPSSRKSSTTGFSSPDKASVMVPDGSFSEDFITISEFSELVGPICLRVMPEDGSGSFDLSRFVLKIMSVDHQAKSGESGVFGEDTQVVFFEPLEEAWCFVHHLTLLDIHARGYVRPVCFTYATRDNDKLLSNFQGLMQHFTDISDTLKQGNYELFREDLKKRMADLAYTKGVVDTMEGASQVTAATPGIITRHFEDMKQMRSKMKQATRRGEGGIAVSVDEDVDITSFGSAKKKIPLPPPGSASPLENTNVLATLDTDDEEKTSHDDDDDDDDDEGSDLDEEDHLGEIMVNIVRALGIDRDYKPRVIQSLHKTRTLSSTLRSLEQLCGEQFAPAMGKLEKVLLHYSRSNLALLLEAEDVALMQPSSSALVVGGVPLLNFNWQADQSLSAGLPVGMSASETTDADDYDFKSFTGASSQMSTDMLDQTMAYAHSVVLASRPVSARSTSSSFRASSFPALMAGKHLLVVGNDAPQPPAASQAPLGDQLMPLGPFGIASRLWPQPDDPFAPPSAHEEEATLSQVLPSGGGSSRPVSIDMSDFGPSMFDVSALPSGANVSLRLDPAMLLRRFSFSKHALFSVLKGRPLIVYGHSQEMVAQVVHSYSLVAPFCMGNKGIEPWLDRAPRLSDLSDLVVIGLSKSLYKISVNVARYVSVLDVDQGTLDAPPYLSGRLLEGICDPARRWHNSEAYLAFVYAELAEIATLACLYYYTCCVGVPMDPSCPEDEALVRDGRFHPNTSGTTFRKSVSPQMSAPLMEQPATMFWRDNGLSLCDSQIIQNLCEIIKQQQCQELYGAGNTAPLIKLDYAKCERFVDTLGTWGSATGIRGVGGSRDSPKTPAGTPHNKRSSLTPRSLFGGK